MKSIHKLLAVSLVLVVSWSCKEKKKEMAPKEKFFPTISFLRSQAAQVDSSLYTIRKYTYIDSAHTDTQYIPREHFTEVAQDFLSLPDIALPEYSDRYTESKDFDETLDRVLLIYLPVKAEDEKIQRQEVLIRQDPSGDKVTSVIINTHYSSKDSTVEKRLFWTIDESFQVTTTRQLPQQPETTVTYKVAWNEPVDEPEPQKVEDTLKQKKVKK